MITKNNKKPSYTEFKMNEYINGPMQADMEEFIKAGEKKTGFSNMDKKITVYPGFYVLGAISSLGKTTFMHQMCDQMAQLGTHVIYFTIEQSVLELASKSLSRLSACLDKGTAMSALEIRKSPEKDTVGKAIQKYADFAGNITVVECSFRVTVKDIEDYVESYIKEKENKPVVFVDYLQAISAPDNSRISTRELVDMNVRRLKSLQVNNKIPVIVISSLNRQNYLMPIDFESFKESGGIEYTADVIWGLQLRILEDPEFIKNTNIIEKRKKVKDAKNANPRKIDFICLKNRFGISGYQLQFEYYPQYDYFVPEFNGIGPKPEKKSPTD